MVSVARSNNYSIKTQDSATIASGIATIGTGYLVLTSESGTADSVTQFTLDTDLQSALTSDKGVWFFVTAAVTHTITLVHDGTNIKSNTGADVVLTSAQMALCFISPSNVVNIMTTTSSSSGGTFSSITVTGTSTLGVVNASNLVTVTRTTEQLRLAYDGSNYSSFTVSSGGDLTIAPTGLDTTITGRGIVSSDFTVDTTTFKVDATNDVVYMGGTTSATATASIQGSISDKSALLISSAITTTATAFLMGITGTMTTTVAQNVISWTPTYTISNNVANNRIFSLIPTLAGGFNMNTTADVFRIGATVNNSGGTIASLVYLHLNQPTLTAGTTTTRYYIRADDMASSSTADYVWSSGVGWANFGDRVGIKQTSPTGQLHVNQSSTTGAIPSIHMEQDDVSEEFIRLTGQAQAATLTQSLVPVAAVGSFTVNGYLKINVQDEGNQITDGAYYIAFGTLA